MRLFDLINNRLPDTLHLVGAEDKVLLRQEGGVFNDNRPAKQPALSCLLFST